MIWDKIAAQLNQQVFQLISSQSYRAFICLESTIFEMVKVAIHRLN